MTTNLLVKMMYSMSNRSFEDLKMTAENECIAIPEHISKIELITLIISTRAEREARNNDREKYCLHAEGEKYYLRLTTEQVTMLEWCLDNEINFYNAVLESIGEVEWETP